MARTADSAPRTRRRTRSWLARTGLALTLALGAALPASAAQDGAAAAGGGGINDFSCKPSSAHPEPVVLLHGTFATWYEDINFLQADLAARGYCTFASTYGEYPEFPLVGGLKPVAESNVEIKEYVEKVRGATGAAKVAVVGHSEGGLQSLYLAKMQGIQPHIARVVAIAPPTHGTDAAGLVKLGDKLLGRGTLDKIAATLGFPVLSDEFPGGPAIKALNDGPVAQPGIAYTIITSRFDEIVTPTETSFVREPGVTNQYVQDFCPLDPVGHIGEAYDLNVWHLVRNALDPKNATRIKVCAVGSPG
ncbi:esterase/lipase family protein [Streptomyces sp. NBC_01304]|uniref:esterase/lipase family protein n=1 Tax=Streptomyces sp. NBC_01304 TaxID=2903818 RepID=UPI002E16302F|nr:alpha/beta fold hydrolase [Streptomyces sp. NBC_01304]